MPAYFSVPLTYAKRMPNVCNVHQRMDKISHTSAYVGAIRCGVSTPLPMQYTEIFLALKIEEKNISDCQILETKSSNIVYLILPCICHYIKVGFNGIYVKANVQLSCKLT